MGEALPRLKTILLLASVLLAGAFLFTACIYTEFTEVDVELGKEWSDGEVEGFLYTNYISVPEGEVVFAVKNEGTFKHDFVVLETDLAPDNLIVAGDRVDLGASGTERGRIQPRYLLPGASNTHTFKLKPGEYVLLSNEPGDYHAGMFAALSVE